MKKLFTILLAVMMLAALALPAFAAEEKGSITINGVGEDAAYDIYLLLDLESYNLASGAYSYKVNSAWTAFFATEDALKYVAIDNAGYVTWVNGDDDDNIAAFAKLALAYAKDNGIAPVQSSENDGEFVITTNGETGVTSGKFSNLDLGYYLVDSTVGALCGLTTTNPDASINAKNGTPSIDKQVQEDSTEQWADQNTADIGQTVYFRVTINVHAGAENYVLHDLMSSGLTFDKVTKVEHIIPGSGNTSSEAAAGVDYTVWTAPGITDAADDDVTDGCTLEVRFSKDFCDKLETNDKLIVYYQAMLNRNAVIAGNGNPNEAWLQYGEDHVTTHDITKTYTFGFDIVKTDSQNTLLDGAKFRIYDAYTDGNEVAVVLMDDGVTYRRARADETGVEIDVKDGMVRIVGFDNGTYYLEETDAPDGYNKLTSRHRFIISDGNLDSIFNNDIYSSGSGVHVVNKTGSMLPETGGLGTTLFIAFGGVAVLATGVLLFVKKRMSQVEE
ncbi:MAG: isopeptide-forming domain-containing fimbrial protein [Ruminococcaceae bacterium]|nr:isopeptide-forming domain-containing fimbrial protein [Oscillospiraceae bacterium]